MQNGLGWIILAPLVIVAVCMIVIIYKFNRYFENKKKIMIYQNNNRKNIEILEDKLPAIKLKNKGHSLDENINFISDDESVVFSMGWGDIIG